MSSRLVSWALAIGLAVLADFGSPGESKGDAPAKDKAAAALGAIRGAKIISIQDVDKINAIDRRACPASGRLAGQRIRPGLRQRLKDSFGIELIIVRSGELLEEMSRVEEPPPRSWPTCGFRRPQR